MSFQGFVGDASIGLSCDPCSSRSSVVAGPYRSAFRQQQPCSSGRTSLASFGRPAQLCCRRPGSFRHAALTVRRQQSAPRLAAFSLSSPLCSSGSVGGSGAEARTRTQAVASAASPITVSGQEAESYVQAGRAAAIGPPTFVKATGRVVAIGDVHGDLPKTIRALEVSGVLGESDGRPIWVGRDTVVVQLGDVLDRGDCEIGVVLLLRELDRQAREAGGAVYMLNGNHESLNIAGDFRYVTAGAFLESAAAAGLRGDALQSWDNQLRARLRLYSPGGPMAMELAKNPTVLVVNDTVFAHGGLLPQHVKYGLDRLNAEVAGWMRGDRMEDGQLAGPPFLAMGNSSSVMWNRTFGKEQWVNPYDRYHACNMLKQTLEGCGASRMVIGHTPQMCGCNGECDGRVWRVDVGMSSGVLDADPQVLFIDKKKDGTTQVKVGADAGIRRFGFSSDDE